jgi:hypothetical protein
VARLLINLGNAYFLRRDLATARRRYDDGLALARNIGYVREVDRGLLALGGCMLEEGEVDEAVTLLEEALDRYRQRGRPQRIASALGGLAAAAARLGNRVRAREAHEEALAIQRQIGDRPGSAETLLKLAQLDFDATRLDEALVLLRRDDHPYLLTQAVELTARLEEDPARATLLAAASETLNARFGTPMGREVRERFEQKVAACRERLGDATFEEAWQRGLGLTLEEALDEVRRPGSAPARRRTRHAILRRDDGGWTIGFDGSRGRIPDMRGLRAIAALVRRPGNDVHAAELVAAWRGGAAARATTGEHLHAPSDVGAVLDGAARDAYRARIGELRSQIEEADAWNDDARAAAARAELDAVTSELARATSLGGRDRRAGAEFERARVNVANAVRQALAKIAEVDSSMAVYLRGTIRTGLYSCYTPDPAAPVQWET